VIRRPLQQTEDGHTTDGRRRETMPGPAAIFRELHRLHRHAKDLRDQIDRGPLTLKATQNKVTRQEELLREAQDAVKKLKVAIREKEVSLKGKQQLIEKHQKQLNESTSKKEYDALQAEINADKKGCQKLEDDILEAMADVEARTAGFAGLEKNVATAKEEAARAADNIQARRHQLAEQLDAANKLVAEVEETLPDDVKAPYRRLLAFKKEDALSPVQGRSCIACYTEVTAQNFNELKQDQFVVCKTCGRILYRVEE